MAKKRRVKSAGDSESQSGLAAKKSPSVAKPVDDSTTAIRISPLKIALAILAGTLVYVSYYPSDSVAVENGDALWFGLIAILIATIAVSDSLWNRTQICVGRGKIGFVLDALACGLAIWVMLAAFMTAPPGNLRVATNEAWLWISGAAVFIASRRILAGLEARRTIVLLIAVCAIALAAHGLHQEWIGLPNLQAQYEADKDKVLAQVGVVAPEGSSERMVFENRLYDGGASGTFALANSLAGSLLVGCVIAIAALRFQWRQMQVLEKAAWLIALLICVCCLSYARSRSATGATILGAIAVLLGPTIMGANGNAETKPRSRSRAIALIFAACSAAMLAVASVIAAFGKSEWFEQAIPSLAFRFQYWRSTLQLVLDRPLFGCGPGNFQSIYLQYREPSANEQIADPHNFLFETLSSGGFIAGLVLVALLSVAAWLGYQNWFSSDESVGSDHQLGDAQLDDHQPTDHQPKGGVRKWSWLGAGVALFLIWFLGFISGQFPDFQAQAIAVPIAIGLSLLLWPAVGRLTSYDIDLISVACIGALMVHLLVAGGWTIPGVAMSLWLLTGALTRVTKQGAAEHKATRSLVPVAVSIGVGVVLLLCLRSFSLTPVQQSQRAMGDLMALQSQRSDRVSPRAMNAALQQVIQSDPWAPDGYLVESDLIHLQIVARDSVQGGSAERKKWQFSLQQALQRAGQNPALYRAAAQQVLHVYQRWGNPYDLRQASELLSTAAAWSPADHWILAQLAAVSEKMGDSDRARNLARDAKMFALLGNNAERSLDRQMIYAAQVFGGPAKAQPIIVPASEALANQLDNLPVEDQN